MSSSEMPPQQLEMESIWLLCGVQEGSGSRELSSACSDTGKMWELGKQHDPQPPCCARPLSQAACGGPDQHCLATLFFLPGRDPCSPWTKGCAGAMLTSSPLRILGRGGSTPPHQHREVGEDAQGVCLNPAGPALTMGFAWSLPEGRILFHQERSRSCRGSHMAWPDPGTRQCQGSHTERARQNIPWPQACP